MKNVYDFLKKCKTYYLATSQGDQARVRPFGTVDIFEDKLYIMSGKEKDVSKQMHANPKIEICACAGAEWLRVEAKVTSAANNKEAEAHMLEAYPELKADYEPGDGKMELFYMTEATATFSSFTTEPKVTKF